MPVWHLDCVKRIKIKRPEEVEMKKFTQALLVYSIIFSTLAQAQVRPRPGGPGTNPRPPGTNPRPPGGPGTNPHPGGPGTNPTQPPAPVPTYTPNPTQAQQTGFGEGHPQGQREGNDRGPSEGREAGRVAGYNQGFKVCGDQERQRQYDQGYRHGLIEGEQTGSYEGNQQGQINGNNEGNRDGDADGRRRADRDANIAATPVGSAQGEREAEQSDAAQKGYADGLVAGDQAARDEARRVDYPRGRQDVKNEKYAEPVQNQDRFAQKVVQSASSLAKALGLKSLSEKLSKLSALASHNENINIVNVNASPDFRYSHPTKTFPTQVEQQAYLNGYRSGYTQGFSSTYKPQFDNNYQIAYNNNYPAGCNAGRSQDFRYEYARGRDAGRREGYRIGFDRAYRPAYDQAYGIAFQNASQNAYQNSYQAYYNQHFEAARARAYQRRYTEIYNSNFNTAKNLKFNQMYPTYADQEYKRGRADEEQDFVNRPLRIIGVEATETIQNGLFEPGEPLRVRLQVRNFSTSAMAAQDVTLSIRENSNLGAVINVPLEGLVQGLKNKSVTDISQALGFALTEKAVKQGSSFTVTVKHRGLVMSEDTIDLTAQFALDVSFAEPPVLKEGIETPIKVLVRNQSQTAIDAGTSLTLVSKPEMLEVTKGDALLSAIGSGQEQVIEFRGIARISNLEGQFPISISAKEKTGRRIGLLEGIKEIPVKNDYKVTIRDSLPNLRNADKVKVEMNILNVSSRLSTGSVSVRIKFLGPNADNFSVKGDNPVLVKSIDRGDSEKVEFKVISKNSNSGGTLEFEVVESGTVVVVHRENF